MGVNVLNLHSSQNGNQLIPIDSIYCCLQKGNIFFWIKKIAICYIYKGSNMRYILLVFLSFSLLHAEVRPTQEMIDNNIESPEFQFFVTKTRNIETSNLKQKIVFEGELEEYYEFYNKLMTKGSQAILKANLGEAGLQTFNGAVSNTISSGAGGNSPEALLASMGIGIAVNQALLALNYDASYLQITDYYQDKIPVTRMIKLIVSDESLEYEEVISIFKTSNTKNYHFAEGYISEMAY